MSLANAAELFVMTGYDSGTDNWLNDVWKTADLINWTRVLADGHGQFAGRDSAAGVM